MKRLSLAAIAAMLFALPAAAQGDLQAKYEAKLTKEFAKKAAWEQKLSDAQAKALASNKLILGYFTRSYAP